jgi:hypothetical protein
MIAMLLGAAGLSTREALDQEELPVKPLEPGRPPRPAAGGLPGPK